MLAARRPLARVIADPATPTQLKARLELAGHARAFATAHLHLPRNRSYTNYADLDRPYAMWNVFVTPEFSLAPSRQCFPIAACVAYRGSNEIQQTRSDQVDALVRATRARRQELYASALPPQAMRARKGEQIERLRADYLHLRATQWHGEGVGDDWINSEINNAKLAPFGLYQRWLRGFAALYTKHPGDWPAFYAAAALGRMQPDGRRSKLIELDESRGCHRLRGRM